MMATDRRDAEVDTEGLATTIGMYVLGEISLVKAAEEVGVTRWEMQEILKEHGVEPKLGPADMADAAEEIQDIRDLE